MKNLPIIIIPPWDCSFKDYIRLSDYLEIKINAMKIFSGEMGEFPFPRSGKNIRSLARFRGCQSGFFAAEAFELVYERK